MENKKIDLLFGVVIIAFLAVTFILIKEINYRRANDFKEYTANLGNIVKQKNNKIKVLSRQLMMEQSENEGYKGRYVDLKGQYEVLQGQYNDLKDKYDDLKSKNDDLKTTLENTRNDLDVLTKKLSQQAPVTATVSPTTPASATAPAAVSAPATAAK